MKYIQILIDHANLVYRSYYSAVRFINIRPWMPVIRYFDMLRLVSERVKRTYPKVPIKFAFAGESKTTLRRTTLDPKYKAHRKPNKDEDLRKFRNVIVKLINGSGWELIRIDGAEADDIIASLTAKNSMEAQTVVYSNDRDLRQLLSYPNTVMFQNPGMFYTRRMFKIEHGFDPDKYLYYKALVGDKSDNISGVNGWGPVKSKKYIIAGNWLESLQPNEVESYKNSLALSDLDYSLDVSIPERVNRVSKKASIEKVLRKIYGKDSIQEVMLALNRFEVAHNYLVKP